MRPLVDRRLVATSGLAALTVLAGVVWPEEPARVERPKAGSAVSIPGQGGGGLEPVLGSPPALEPPAGPIKTVGRVDPPAARASRAAPSALAGLEAVSMAVGEATLEVDGARQVVRPGTPLLRGTVKSVAPGRLVLERPSSNPKAPGTEMVIVTFDEAGRARTLVLWTSDPTAPVAPEVKQP